MSSIWQDLRYALRRLGKDRGFVAIAVFTLALGIGATTIIFSIVYNGLLNPFPYRSPHRLANFYFNDLTRAGSGRHSAYTIQELADYRKDNHVFEDIIGVTFSDVLFKNGQGTQEFDGALVTPNTFPFLGVKPLIGRYPIPEDGKPGAPPVFVINYRLWKSQFNGDPKVVGKTFTLNGERRTLIGVMPPRFQYSGADLWLPVSWSASANVTGGPAQPPDYFLVMGRLKPGVSLKAAAADLQLVAKHLSKVYSKDYPKKFNAGVSNLADTVVGGFKAMLYILVGAVTLLLLIACSNVANLLLSRATARRQEIAIRASVGASRGRLVRQLMVESFVLALAGGAVGCLFAYGGLDVVMAVMPRRQLIPEEAVISVNFIALAFALGVTIVTTLLCGLAPALHAVRGDLHARLKDSGRGMDAGGRGNLRSALVVLEVTLSIVLLVGAGLMMRSLFAIEHVELGFNPEHILVVRTALPKGRYDSAKQKQAFFQPVLDRIEALPGVVAATETASLPPYGGPVTDATVPGKTHAQTWRAMMQLCSEGYFNTLGHRLIRGRLLTRTDVDTAQHVAVVNQMLAVRFFGKDDPIGQKIQFNLPDHLPNAPHSAAFEIIGVAQDAKNQGLQEPSLPEAFVPYTITGAFERGLLIRTALDPLSLLASVRRVIWNQDSNVALTDTGTVEYYLKRYSYEEPEFDLLTLGAFAGIGLALVIVGVFSVMAYSVSLRTHEIGVRMALGAQRADILRMVLLKGLRLVAAGIILGEVASVALARVLTSQIWGVAAFDPFTFGVVAAVIIATGALACLLPARRATQVDPLVALRYE